MHSTDLANRSTITEIVNAYRDASDAIRECHARLTGAEDALNARLAYAKGTMGSIGLPRVAARHGHHEDIETQLLALRLAIWSHIVDRLGIWRLCSTKRAEQLRRQLDHDMYRRRAHGAPDVEELPEITEESVLAMVRGFATSLDSILDESIREVFDMLRPREGSAAERYKRNGKEVIGAHATLTYTVEGAWIGGGFRVRYGSAAGLMALENCFRALDGKGGAPASHRSELDMAIEANPDGKGATTYFRFRCYKNKSLHLTFLRPDLVSKLNAHAGGKNFRAHSA